MGFFKNQDLWLSRGGFTAVLVGAFILLKVMLDNNPSMFPSYITDFAISKQPPPQNCVECANNPNLIGESGSLLDPIVMANSFLPCKDYVKPGISTFELSNISHYFKTALEDSELLHAAQDAATRPLAPGKPRIAFLFIIRQEIPYLPVWERFFDGVDNDTYSIYTHPSWWANDFPNTSVFHNRAISFKDVHRYSITLVDVVRRLLAFALLDHEKPNLWFALASEACVPVRSFPHMYDYFMNSRTSFVEAFSPKPWYRLWETLPHFRKEQLRKGELWNSVHRRHAGMIVGDVTFYRKFKADCVAACTLDEEYVQTLLFVKDPEVRAFSTSTRAFPPVFILSQT